jgi:hypothetical protein
MAPAARRRRANQPKPPLWNPRSQPNSYPSGERVARTQPANQLPHERTSSTYNACQRPTMPPRMALNRSARPGKATLELNTEAEDQGTDRPPGQIWPRNRPPGPNRRPADAFSQAIEGRTQLVVPVKDTGPSRPPASPRRTDRELCDCSDGGQI